MTEILNMLELIIDTLDGLTNASLCEYCPSYPGSKIMHCAIHDKGGRCIAGDVVKLKKMMEKLKDKQAK